MRNAAELRQLCEDFRYHDRETTDEDVRLIEADVAEYRDRFLTRPAPQLPPEPLCELLPLMGWLIYEASWFSVRNVRAGFDALDETGREPSLLALDQVKRLANAARALVWPEFAGRALGAIRAHALAESKRDNEAGYDAAYIVHREADERHRSYRDALGDAACRDRYLLDLDEMLLQLALAETGTACRTAERVIGRWAEEFAQAGPRDEERWVQRMYRSLSDGVAVGMRALDTAKRIQTEHGLVRRVTAERLALVTGFRNPGIMTARAVLLMLSLGPAMEHMGRQPSRGETWHQEREALLAQFAKAYQAVEAPITDADDQPVPMVFDHKRALVQLRLNLALLVPGRSLPSIRPFHPCLEPDPLDEEAVAALSEWLSTVSTEDGGPRGTAGAGTHGNTVGAATLPLFIQSVVALRSLTGDGAGYLEWRQRWFPLGRYAEETGRRGRVDAAVETAMSRPSLRIGAQ